MKVTQVARVRHIRRERKDQEGMFVGFNYQENPEYEVLDEAVYNRIIDAYESDKDIEPIFKEFDHNIIIGIKEPSPF